jgi:hypothetical protein
VRQIDASKGAAMNIADVGDRVRLVRTLDEFTRLTPGALGTVTYIDSMRTVHVKWDDGSSLGMVAEAGDQFVRVTP